MPKNKNNENNNLSQLLQLRKYGEETFDKLIVSISSGAIVFTVGFVKDLFTDINIKFHFLLISAWVLFSISLIVILISQKTSVAAIDARIVYKLKNSVYLNKITDILNYISFISLVLGVILFMLFSIYNFNSKVMSNNFNFEPKPDTSTGVTIPPSPQRPTIKPK